MELTAWVSLASICLMGAMTPGPSLAVVLKHTISGGRSHGLMTAMAHAIGMALYATLSIVGLAVLIQQSPVLFDLIRYVSVAFLLYLAYKALTSNSALAKLDEQTNTVTMKQSFIEGVMITFVNPKLAIFFVALFSQFIQPDAGWIQNVVMVSTAAGIDSLWYCFIAVVLSQSSMLSKLRNNSHIIEKITGVALILVAARVVLT